MKMYLAIVMVMIIAFSCKAHAAKNHQIRMSLEDTFTIVDSGSWKFEIEKELSLRFADIKVTPRHGQDFSMMLYFKCDTPDLSQFDTPKKIRQSVEASSQEYLPGIIEKKIVLQPVPIASTYGFFTIMTDAEVAAKKTLGPGEFKYMTRGMVRLSKDSVLSFSIMSNSTGSRTYKALVDYVYGFVKRPDLKR